MIELEIPDHPYFAGMCVISLLLLLLPLLCSFLFLILIPTKTNYTLRNWPLMEQRLVPPLWIPGRDILHEYTATKPLFTPGEEYDARNDPFPEFHYISPISEDGFEDGDEDEGISGAG